MPVWGALAAVLGFNYARHRRGFSTLCSSARRVLSARAFLVAWALLSAWLIPHYWRGFTRRP